MIFSFGQSQYERIEVEVLHYERERAGEYFDDNWLTVLIFVQAGGFTGKIRAAILTGELTILLKQLRALHTTLAGTAEFTTMEEQLHLLFSGDGKGHIELEGSLADQPGIGNRLHFSLQFDQSQLGTSICELEKVALGFPVREA